jgi:nitrate reductase delta subunit
MHPAAIVAMGFRYPSPTAADELSAAIAGLHPGAVERHMHRFLDSVSSLELGAWEELHTATIDLTPQFIPYVGDVAWGENYRRGAFMAELKVSMERNGVELAGELPDHIEPVLRYLAVAEQPLADLVDVLPSSVATMKQVLHNAAPDNPYRHLLAATVDMVTDMRPLTIGKRI